MKTSKITQKNFKVDVNASALTKIKSTPNRELRAFAKNAKSISEILRNLGIYVNGRNIEAVNRRLNGPIGV